MLDENHQSETDKLTSLFNFRSETQKKRRPGVKVGLGAYWMDYLDDRAANAQIIINSKVTKFQTRMKYQNGKSVIK